MLRNMGLAADMGILKVPDGLLVELDEAMLLPDEKLVLEDLRKATQVVALTLADLLTSEG